MAGKTKMTQAFNQQTDIKIHREVTYTSNTVIFTKIKTYLKAQILYKKIVGGKRFTLKVSIYKRL